MIKFIINIIEIVIILKVIYFIIKYGLVRKIWRKTNKKKSLSIFKKIILLFSRQIHFILNSMIKKQKRKFVLSKSKDKDRNTKIIKNKENTESQDLNQIQKSNEKIINIRDIKKYKSKKIN